MIKLIAMVTMLIDHIGVVFFPDALWLRMIGRIAFPLFAWGIARGYKYTRNFKWYALRLLAAGLISQLPYIWLFGKDYLNICFTLLDGLLVLKLYDSKRLPAPVIAIGIAALLAVSHFMNLEYGIYGVLTILFFFLFWEDNNVFIYQGVLTLAGIMAYRYHEIQFISILSSFITTYLRKYDFRLNKYVQYGFYPLHIIILLLIRNSIG
jgi:hypothetical protein